MVVTLKEAIIFKLVNADASLLPHLCPVHGNGNLLGTNRSFISALGALSSEVSESVGKEVSSVRCVCLIERLCCGAYLLV